MCCRERCLRHGNLWTRGIKCRSKLPQRIKGRRWIRSFCILQISEFFGGNFQMLRYVKNRFTMPLEMRWKDSILHWITFFWHKKAWTDCHKVFWSSGSLSWTVDLPRRMENLSSKGVRSLSRVSRRGVIILSWSSSSWICNSFKFPKK